MEQIKSKNIQRHNQSFCIFPWNACRVFLHLARQPVANMGYPSIFALLLAFAFILIPVELGYFLYQGKKKTGRFTLQGIISYRNPIPWWQYIVWPIIIVVVTGAIVTLLKPVDAFLQEKLFFWMPDIKLRIRWQLFQDNIDRHILDVLNI